MKRRLKRKKYCLCVLYFALLLSSCSVSHRLQNNQKLLVKHSISCDDRKIDTDEIKNYVKPKPNRSFLGFRTRLYFYYAFQDSEGRFGTWLRDIVGEEPVIFDESLVTKNEEQIRLYLNELGYYNAKVSSSVEFKGKRQNKVVDKFSISAGKLFTISNLSYQIQDSSLADAIQRRANSSKLREGKPFSIELLQTEQERIVRVCKNAGYYAFSKDNIIFAADTTHGADRVSLVISIKKTTENSLKKHTIVSTTINQNYKQENQRRSRRLDTITQVTDSIYVKESTILQANFIDVDKPYRLSRVERTQKILSSFPLFKQVNIEFQNSDNQSNNETVNLDCYINIVPEKRQSIAIDVEGTNTSGEWGAAINTAYTNRNLFHGAEICNLELKLAGEYNNVLKEDDDNNLHLFNSLEYGFAFDFTTQKFLMPFSTHKANKKFRAKTNCQLAYNYLQTPDYTRPTSEVNFGYTWYGQRFVTFNLNPVSVSYIRYYDLSERFNTFVNSRNYYKYSYEDYLLYSNNFSLVYYNKRKNDLLDYQYFRLYTETSGNLMYLYCKATNKEKNAVNQYETWNLPFAQYIKTELDYRYYDVLSSKTTLVYRIFGGISIPYLNSEGLPSVKKYYAGGANSMRAWECRSLGIGSHQDTTNSFKYYLGDVKLELNLEARFHLFWVIDGAAFVDVGNIWSLQNDELEGAEFHLNDFYKDFAVGTGFGLRCDFSFLILRCDLGVKVREPYSIPNSSSHIIWGNRKMTRDDFNFNLGIGYPF